MAARPITTGKAVAGGEREAGTAVAGTAAFAVGDTRNGARCFLDRQCGLAQRGGVGFATVINVEILNQPLKQHLLSREPRIGIFGRLARHRDTAFDQFG